MSGMDDEFTHGLSGYVNRKCRCKVCRAANVAYCQRQRAKRASKPLPAGRRHGVYTTYSNYGCRCERCKQAAADQRRRVREQRKAAE